MTLVAYLNGSDVAHKIRIGAIGLSSRADSTGAFGNIVFDDEEGTMTVRGWMSLEVEETDCSVPRLHTGYIWERDYGRSGEVTYRDGPARFIDTRALDQNAVLSVRLITGSDGKRPAETHIERIDWLLGSSYLSGLIVDNGLVDRSTPRPFEEADYRGQYPADVLSDLAGPIFRTFFAYWDHATDEVALFFDTPNTTVATSTLTISNVLSDLSSTCFPPFLDATLNRDPSEVYSRIRYSYANGTAIESNSGTLAAFFTDNGLGHRGLQVDNSRVGLDSTARSMAQRILTRDSGENDTISVTIQLPSDKVGLLDAGQRVGVRFTHLPGYETLTYTRVTARTITHAPGRNDLYNVQLELNTHGLSSAGGSGAAPPGDFPHQAATSPVYHQSAAGTTTTSLTNTTTATLAEAPLATDILVGLVSTGFGGGTAGAWTWPAGWTVIDEDVTNLTWSLAIGTGITSPVVTVTTAGSAEWLVLGVVAVRGGSYEQFTTRIEPGSPGTDTPALPSITPDTGKDAVIVAIGKAHQAYSLVTSPTGYTVRLNTDSNDGAGSNRINAWTRAISPTTGASYNGDITYAGNVQGDFHQVVISGGVGSTSPQPGQAVPPAAPNETPDGVIDEFTTLYPYATGSLRIEFNGVELDPGVDFTETDPATGTFTFTNVPPVGSEILVWYQGR